MEDRQVSEDEKVAGMGENKEPSHNPKEPDVDDSLSLIGGRINKGEFPPVLPTQQQSLSEHEAKEVFGWAQKQDAGRMRDYLDGLFVVDRNKLPHGCGHEAVHSQAKWAMECSYQHLKEYKACLEAEDVVAQTIKSFGV